MSENLANGENMQYHNEQHKIFDRFANDTGVDILQSHKIASNIPTEFFQQRSNIAVENDNKLNELVYEPPAYNPKEDYFAKYWTSFVSNERVLNEIQEVSMENQRSLNQIYNLEDFYENNLLPKMFAFPNQYVARMVKNNKGGKAQKENVVKSREDFSKSPSKENMRTAPAKNPA